MKKRLKKMKKSIGYASKGLNHTYRTQQNIWIHSTIAIFVFIAALFLGLSHVELAIIVITILLVLLLETINTVIETIIDLASPEFTELGKIAKDVSAGSVLLAAIGSVVVGILILGQPFLLFIESFVSRR